MLLKIRKSDKDQIPSNYNQSSHSILDIAKFDGLDIKFLVEPNKKVLS